MEFLLALLNTIFGLIFFFGLLLLAFLLLVAPKLASQVLRRLLQAFALWLFLSFTLCQLAALWDGLSAVGGGSLFLIGLLISGIAYLIYRLRHPHAKQPLELRGAERIALMPQHEINPGPDAQNPMVETERKQV